jgi:hypothetical protein
VTRGDDFAAERRLLEGVLRDAIECWQACAAIPTAAWAGQRRHRLHREADFWIFGEYENAPFFSFTKICDCLGLDPNFIRRRLLEWKHAMGAAKET